MKKLPHVKYDIIDLSGYLGYGNPLYYGPDITVKKRAEQEEIRQRSNTQSTEFSTTVA